MLCMPTLNSSCSQLCRQKVRRPWATQTAAGGGSADDGSRERAKEREGCRAHGGPNFKGQLRH